MFKYILIFSLISLGLAFNDHFMTGPPQFFKEGNVFNAPRRQPNMLFNPYSPFFYPYNRAINPHFNVLRQRAVMKESRLQALFVAERFLSKNNEMEQFSRIGLAKNDCNERSFCEFAANDVDNSNKDVKKAIQATVQMFEGMLAEMPENEKDYFPQVRRLIGAFAVGFETKNASLCQWLFPCYTPASLPAPQVQARNTCKATANFCPALAISCGFCGIASPFTCPVVCPISAVYCGASGIACAEEKMEMPETNERPENGQMNDEIKQDKVEIEIEAAKENAEIEVKPFNDDSYLDTPLKPRFTTEHIKGANL